MESPRQDQLIVSKNAHALDAGSHIQFCLSLNRFIGQLVVNATSTSRYGVIKMNNEILWFMAGGAIATVLAVGIMWAVML